MNEILLVVLGAGFVLWLVAAISLRERAREQGVFEIWRGFLLLLALVVLVVLVSILAQYVIVGEYWN